GAAGSRACPQSRNAVDRHFFANLERVLGHAAGDARRHRAELADPAHRRALVILDVKEEQHVGIAPPVFRDSAFQVDWLGVRTETRLAVMRGNGPAEQDDTRKSERRATYPLTPHGSLPNQSRNSRTAPLHRCSPDCPGCSPCWDARKSTTSCCSDPSDQAAPSRWPGCSYSRCRCDPFRQCTRSLPAAIR